MVGPWPLAPHHDHLQCMHHVHLMQRGQNRGIIVGKFLKDSPTPVVLKDPFPSQQ